MMEKKRYPIAEISDSQAEKIRRLESDLTKEQGTPVVLVAYEEK